MKSVVQIADFNGPYGGNFIASLEALERYLAIHGWRQTVILRDTARQHAWFDEFSRGRRVHLLSPHLNVLQQARAIAAILEAESATVAHTHFSRFDLGTLLASRLPKARTPRVIWHFHSPVPFQPTPMRQFSDFVKLGLAARMVTPIVVSEGGRQTLLERGLTSSHAQVIANGIEPVRLQRDPQARLDIRSQLGLSEHDRLVLLLGHDLKVKGVDVAVKAFEAIRTSSPNLFLTLVGRMKLLDELPTTNGDRPSFIKLLPTTNQINRYYSAADIFLSASRAEGFPYAVTEAMYMGLPVISSDIRGVEWAKASSGVWFFSTENPADLGRVLLEVSHLSAEQRQAAGSENHALIVKKYTLDRWVESVFDLYQKVLQDQHG